MSARVKELYERELRLQQRCAAQRASIARELASMEARFERVDRIARVARTTLLHPVVIVGGIVPDADLEFLRELGIQGIFPPGTRTDAITSFIAANVRSRQET